MAKFKIGDRVKIVGDPQGSNSNCTLPRGSYCFVREDSFFPFVSSEPDGKFGIPLEGCVGYINEDFLELAPEPTHQSKFKVGDRVQNIPDGYFSEIPLYSKGTVTGISNRMSGGETPSPLIIVRWDKHETSEYYEGFLELITQEPQYTQLHPKVGDKFRVVKKRHPIHLITVGEIVEVVKEMSVKTTLSDDFNLYGYCTTEYLEPIEEEDKKAPQGCNTIQPARISSDMFWGISTFEPVVNPYIKPNQKTKMTNFIKKLTQSADDKALEKAGFIDSCGDLTGRGSDALESLVFQEKKEALVKLANELIAESKE